MHAPEEGKPTSNDGLVVAKPYGFLLLRSSLARIAYSVAAL